MATVGGFLWFRFDCSFVGFLGSLDDRLLALVTCLTFLGSVERCQSVLECQSVVG